MALKKAEFIKGRELYLQGVAKIEIAKQLGVNPSTISGWAKEWDKDKKRLQELQEDIEGGIVEVIKDDLTRIFKDSFKLYVVVVRGALEEATKAYSLTDTEKRLRLFRKTIEIAKSATSSMKTILPEANEEIASEIYSRLRDMLNGEMRIVS